MVSELFDLPHRVPYHRALNVAHTNLDLHLSQSPRRREAKSLYRGGVTLTSFRAELSIGLVVADDANPIADIEQSANTIQ
jgi:hypothetical protein